MEIDLGYESSFDLIEVMNDWCYRVDQGEIDADRGFTYREFFDLFNDSIEAKDIDKYIIFWIWKYVFPKHSDLKIFSCG